MNECIGVYLHGFLSSGKSEKGQWLAKKIASERSQSVKPLFKKFITVTYPIKSVKHSVQVIENILLEHSKNLDKIILLGSSMGGYYAQFVGQKYHIPYIMINPALNPTPVFLKNMGTHTNPSTGEEVCINQQYIADLQAFDVKLLQKDLPALLLIDIDDEVIDVDFAIQKYQTQQDEKNLKVIRFSGGDHRFVHMDKAWLDIKAFIAQI